MIALAQLALSEATLQNLLTLSQRKSEIDEVVEALRKLDVGLAVGPRKNDVQAYLEKENEVDEAEDETSNESDLEFLTMLAEADIDEEEAREIYAEMSGTQGNRRRTWQQGKAIRTENKLQRGFERSSQSQVTGGSSGERGPQRTRRPRLDIVAYKKISRCARCNEVGHWARECPKPDLRPKSGVAEATTNADR